MSLNQVDKSVRPYYDTFDETKGFHQVLFTPGRAVQTREVNELQSILQNQIAQFGNNIFENGTKVVGGEINYDMKTQYITVSGVEWDNIVGFVSNPNVKLQSSTTTVSAKISHYSRDNGSDAITFYLKYETGDTDGNRFNIGEQIRLEDESGTNLGNMTVSGNGIGSLVHINEGYYFINGYFVYTPEQHAILSKYTNNPTVIVGFALKESFVTSNEDQTLLDNASGTTNFNAIGADRLKISAQLVVHGKDDQYDKKNFVKLASFVNGELQEVINRTDYNIIRDEMARRSYDTNGDYTVTPFNVFVTESDDESKYRLGIEAGKAYVRGYEIEKLVTSYVENNKARDTIEQQNATQELDLGSYILIKDAKSIPNINGTTEFEFFDDKLNSSGVVSGNSIGKCFVRQIRMTNNQIRLYVYRLKNKHNKNDSSFISEAKSIRSNGGPVFAANLVDSVIYGSRKTGLIYKMPADNLKTLKSGSTNDTSFTVARTFTQRSGTDSRISISCPSSEAFAPISDDSIVSFNNQIVKMSTLNPVYGRNIITMDIGISGANVTVSTGVIKQTSSIRTKAFTKETVTFSNPKGQREFAFGKADVQRIVSVKQGKRDLTHLFTLESGITADYYAESKMHLKPSETITDNNALNVEIEYFQHSGGDYFCVDSYTGIDYKDIPEFDGLKLSDCLDFRPTLVGEMFSEMPMSNSLTSSDVTSYLPRIDLVVLSSSGEFSIVSGVSSLEPVVPATPDNAMAIYTLSVPAYTSNVKDIAIKYIDNKRYTMRDIGKIDKRLTQLEESYTLSLLEVETDAMQVLDAKTGLNRYKNGFFVDNYTSHKNSAWSDSGYKCSISREQGMLRPEFNADAVDFVLDVARSSNIRRTGDLITLNYTDIGYISQPMASSFINVNPYAILTWDGSVTMSPSSDIWYDTKYTDPEVHYEVYNNGVLTQSWNSWQLNWTGSSASNTSERKWSTTERRRLSFVTTATTQTDFTERTTVNEVTNVQLVNDRIVDTNVVPFMREKAIEVEGKGFMPFSKLYAFFDNVNVTEYCSGVDNGVLKVDREGNIKFTFTIPNNDKQRFRSGSKVLKLIDNIQNNDLEALTYGESEFTSKGIINTRTQTINATKNITTTTTTTSSSRTTLTTRQLSRGGRDPVAQSFIVTEKGGIFLTEVEVFFQSKDETKPIRLELREMEHGTPTLTKLPYGDVLLNPSEVQVSNDASKGTKFRFVSPVYLNENAEYCFVLLTNSIRYNVWKATMGEVQIDKDEAIAKQPFIGVMFKSQNNTTWTEDQMSDLKFYLRRAEFAISQPGRVTFNATVPDNIVLEQNPFNMTSGSSLVTAKIKNHGLIKGDKFTISGCSGAYLGDALFNKQHTVVNVLDSDTITFNVTTNATVSGSFGADSVISTKNTQASTVQPIVQDMILPSTSIQYGIDFVTGKSISGDEQPYIQTGTQSVVVNDNNMLDFPVILPSKENAKNTKTVMTSLMSSEMPNISPVIDLNRVGLIGIDNRINYPENIDDELETTDGKACARHISNVMVLTEPANSLKIITDLCKPQNTDVIYFYRTGNTADEVKNKAWSKFAYGSGNSVTANREYKEFTFSVDNIASFNFYQIKTVMLSKSTAIVPSVRRFRCLALGT